MRKLLPVLFVILVFPAVFQLVVPGFFASDDGEWMVIRFTSFYEELTHLQIPVRYLNRLNQGYGYPVATFLYPGFMYIAALFKVAGFGFIASIKAVLVASVILAFIGMYLFLKNHFSKISCLVGACLYIYNPYFLWDLYKRGSVGEILALAIVPFILYFIDSEKRVFAAVLTAFLIISHNTLAFLFIPFILVYLLITQVSKKISVTTISARVFFYIVIALGVSSFFWVPVAFELPLTVFSKIAVSNFQEYFVSGHFLVGLINIIVLIGAAIYMAVNRKYSLVLYFMTSAALLSLFFSYETSLALWSDNFLGRLVQFPFRFLSIFSITIAYLGGFLFNSVRQYSNILASIIIGFIIVNVFPFVSAVQHKNVPDTYYSTNVDTTTVKNEYMPVWVKNIPKTLPAQEIERIDDATVQINTIFWPGHSVWVDGQRVVPDYSNDQGVMRITTKEPVEKIRITFEETNLRLISDGVSILFAAAALFLSFKKFIYV